MRRILLLLASMGLAASSTAEEQSYTCSFDSGGCHYFLRQYESDIDGRMRWEIWETCPGQYMNFTNGPGTHTISPSATCTLIGG